MMNVPWRTAGIDNHEAERYAAVAGVSIRLAKWLMLRGVSSIDAEKFLAPREQPLQGASVFRDMSRAVSRIRKAISSQETIAIIGDYDVDGVTATAVLSSTFDALLATYTWMIPHRFHDGYGLSRGLVARAKDVGTGLIVTVDNGIQAHDAIQYARTLGIDVVLTDHHAPGDTLPDADAILHWMCSDDPEAVQVLSGAGVVWKLAQALLNGLEHSAELAELLQWHHGLAALGALADVMPMRGETRTLVALGIDALRKCKRPGWVALCAAANVNPQTLNEETILWRITPRLNAAGRMDSARFAVELLMAARQGVAQERVADIEAFNMERKLQTDHATEEAKQQAVAKYGERPTAVVVQGNWHLGVVGIVAARLSETFGCPAIVLASVGDDYRGSGRAQDGFPLHDAIVACADILDHFGGHASAIGCGLQRRNLDMFCAKFLSTVSDYTSEPETGLQPIAEDLLPLRDVSLETINCMQRLAPFGPENPRPTFCVGPVELVSVMPLSGGKHARLRIQEGSDCVEVIWFSVAQDVLDWTPGLRMMCVAFLEESVWQGKRRAQLRMERAVPLPDVVWRTTFAQVYRLLRARRRVTARDCLVAPLLDVTHQVNVVLDTFVDLEFAHFADSAYHVNEQAVPRDLRESRTYQTHLHSLFCRYNT